MATAFATTQIFDPAATRSPLVFLHVCREQSQNRQFLVRHLFALQSIRHRRAVESRYAHWGRADDVTVFAGTTAAWPIAPRLGALQLSCNQSDATFQLLTLDGGQEEAGGFPTLITELPEGNYKLISQHHGHQKNQTLAVKAGTTNDN